MYLLLGIFFTIFTTIYGYKRIMKIKLQDFEEENKELREAGVEIDNSECIEMILNKGFLSDNYLMLIGTILFSFIFIFIKGNVFISAFFIPIIPILCSLYLIDLRMKQLPDNLNYLIGIIGLTYALFSGNTFNHFKMAIMLFVIYFVIAIITGGAMGGGDIKLIGFAGLFFNTSLFITMLIYPFMLGAIQGCYFIFIKKKKGDYKLAFGPVIIISILLLQYFY